MFGFQFHSIFRLFSFMLLPLGSLWVAFTFCFARCRLPCVTYLSLQFVNLICLTFLLWLLECLYLIPPFFDELICLIFCSSTVSVPLVFTVVMCPILFLGICVSRLTLSLFRLSLDFCGHLQEARTRARERDEHSTSPSRMTQGRSARPTTAEPQHMECHHRNLIRAAINQHLNQRRNHHAGKFNAISKPKKWCIRNIKEES